MVDNVTDSDFDEKVLKSPIPVLVDFYADWCGPCKAMAPALEDIAKEYEGEASVVKLDIDANPEMKARYNIQGIPRFLVFNKGEIQDSVLGGASRSKLAAAIDQALDAGQ